MDWDKLMDEYRTARVDASAELCVSMVESVAGPHRYYPATTNGLVLEVQVDHTPFRARDRGLLRCGYGTNLYDWHREVPMEGVGLPIEDVCVVWRDVDRMIAKTAYAAWCEQFGVRIICGRCSEEIDLLRRAPCPAWSERRNAAADSERRQRALDQRRDAWARSSHHGEEIRVLAVPMPGARLLVLHVSTVARARQVGAGYQLDFSSRAHRSEARGIRDLGHSPARSSGWRSASVRAGDAPLLADPPVDQVSGSSTRGCVLAALVDHRSAHHNKWHGSGRR